MRAVFSRISTRRALAIAAGLLGVGIGVPMYFRATHASRTEVRRTHAPGPPATGSPREAGVVQLSPAQQKAIGLSVVPVVDGQASVLLQAPGQVLPDETKFAYITPRAPGIVRTVAGHEGQQVSAGDLLATVDSSEVAQARFDLVTRLQELDIARERARWQETIYTNTVALLDRLEAGDTPEVIHRQFEDRPVGSNREQLITAYANQRLARATFDRQKALHQQKVITAAQFQQALAGFESAEATFKSLTEQMDYTARLAHTQAQQALRAAETAVSVAQERLRVLGVRPDGTEPKVSRGKVVGVKPDGTLPPAPDGSEAIKPEAILPGHRAGTPEPVAPAGAKGDDATSPEHRPVSTYSIWAPFDGTVLDRMLIVPGVYVDTTHRIFTLADLSTVWVEAHIHESDLGTLARGRKAEVRFSSPAYPGTTFPAEILYKGDLVDAKSRRLKLLARAENPERLLKPGMFVDVQIRIPSDRTAALVPRSAVLSHDEERLVFVQAGPDRFERRAVVTGSARGDLVEVLEGVRPGERVVSAGAFKLKAEALHEAPQARSPGERRGPDGGEVAR